MDDWGNRRFTRIRMKANAMNTFSLVLLLILVPSISFGQNLPADPYRKIGNGYYDLTQPLGSEWLNSERSSGPILVQYKIDQVLDDGLLVHEARFNGYSGTTVEDKPFFLTNYPGYKNLTDNQKIKFIALRVGSYKFTDTEGALRTIPLYDYGIPVSAQEMNAALYPPLTPEQKAAQAKAEQARHTAGQQAIVKFYQPKAEAGDGFAQMRLGEIYLRGEGVETNTDLARKWLSAAITNGYPQATNLLFETDSKSGGSK
jgi:hypothetical protein